jgi:hypothetical protein
MSTAAVANCGHAQNKTSIPASCGKSAHRPSQPETLHQGTIDSYQIRRPNKTFLHQHLIYHLISIKVVKNTLAIVPTPFIL